MTAREHRRVWLAALGIALLTTLPYLLAWSAQGDAWRFSGFLFGADDGYSYLGKMRLGAGGLWEFIIFYTPEPHEGVALVFLPYIVPGQIVGRLLGADHPALPAALTLTFHALRVIFDILLVHVLYRFIAVFVRPPGLRLAALALAAFGGGLGWLLILLGQGGLLGSLPAEFYIPEGFGFLVLFGLPHVALARAALLGGLLCLFAALATPRPLRPALLAALCWSVVALCVPFYLAVIYALLAAWGLALWLRRRAFPGAFAVRAALAAGLTLPLFAYFSLAFATNPIFAQWSAQNQLPSPHPLHYVLAYALLGVPAWVGGRQAWRRARRHVPAALLVGWPAIVPLLVYLPINVQRRMAEAVIVPLAILAVNGVRVWLRARALTGRRLSRRTRTRLWAAWLTAACLSSMFLIVGALLASARPERPLFRPADELAALAWLDAHAETGAVVLSTLATGNIVPTYTDLRPVVGHGPETLDWEAKREAVRRFFSGGMAADERAALLSRYRVRYVFFGPLEEEIAGTEHGWTAGLMRVYSAGEYAIYEVANP